MEAIDTEGPSTTEDVPVAMAATAMGAGTAKEATAMEESTVTENRLATAVNTKSTAVTAGTVTEVAIERAAAMGDTDTVDQWVTVTIDATAAELVTMAEAELSNGN